MNRISLLVLACLLFVALPAGAATIDVSVKGTDVIFLAGRTDVTIPALGASDPTFTIGRHGFVIASFLQETFPGSIAVAGGDVVRVADPADGGIDFFNGNGPPFYGPEGNTGGVSSLLSHGGISGYHGTQGALVGVFLDNSVPSVGPAPATLNFSTPALRDFASLSPVLGQVFFIGNGVTSGNVFQEFVAPTGATRLFFGIPDGFGFNGPPGAYEDNDGAYRIRVGINQIPTSNVPLPAGAIPGLALLSLIGARRVLRRRRPA